MTESTSLPVLLPSGRAAPRCRTGSDLLAFLRSWTGSPGRVGAIAPSGEALARLITGEIDGGTGPVLELGPGTGVFTRALLERGVRERNLTLIEAGDDFAELLRRRFPEARVLRADARYLPRAGLFDGAAGAVVSGLPLRNLSPRYRLAVLIGAFRHLHPDGAFYQFTYGPRFPLPQAYLDRYGLKAVRIGRTLANLPPAAVYRVTRRKPLPWAGP